MTGSYGTFHPMMLRALTAGCLVFVVGCVKGPPPPAPVAPAPAPTPIAPPVAEAEPPAAQFVTDVFACKRPPGDVAVTLGAGINVLDLSLWYMSVTCTHVIVPHE